jgi:hypothetical protein
MNLQELQTQFPASDVRLIAYDAAEVRTGFNPNIPVLFVSGTLPCLNMTAALPPRIYITCPDYWVIDLLGYLPGDICLEAVKPFSFALPLSGITGQRGIELVAANGRKKFEVAGGCTPLDG